MVDAGHLDLAAAYTGATLVVGYAFVRLGILAVNIAGALALGLVAGAALEGETLIVAASFAAVAFGHWLGGVL